MVTNAEGFAALSILLQLFAPLRWVKYVLLANLAVFGYLLTLFGPRPEFLWLYGLLSAIGLFRVGIWLLTGLVRAGRRTTRALLEQDTTDDWEELPPADGAQADGGNPLGNHARQHNRNRGGNPAPANNPPAVDEPPADDDIPDNVVWPPEDAFDDVELDLDGIDDHRQ